jgi:hypothetical protein
MSRPTLVAFYVKDPDVHCQVKGGEKAREKFCKQYTEYGEYFLIEVDLNTKEGRLLPRSEWSKYGR